MLALQQARAAALTLVAGEQIAAAGERLPDFVRTRVLRLYPAFLELLAEEERWVFADDPMRFVSQQFFFRGMSIPKMRELLRESRMKPESGDYNGTAVFVTDSPVAAAEFMADESALVVLDPMAVEYLEPEHGPYDVSSRAFHALEREFLATLPTKERRLAAYTCIDHWDTIGPFAQGRIWHTISLRKEQPLAAVRFVVMYHEVAGEPLVYEVPSRPEDLELLKQHFGIV